MASKLAQKMTRKDFAQNGAWRVCALRTLSPIACNLANSRQMKSSWEENSYTIQIMNGCRTIHMNRCSTMDGEGGGRRRIHFWGYFLYIVLSIIKHLLCLITSIGQISVKLLRHINIWIAGGYLKFC